MTLGKLKSRQQEQGFTIVELLIVIVVIAILAAITIIAYGGVTNKANESTAKANAQSVQSIAEAYAQDQNGGNGSYAASIAAITTGYTGGITHIPSGISLTALQFSTSNSNENDTTIQYIPKSTTGACIGYWDPALSTPAAVYVYAGNATTGANASTPTCS